MARPRNASTQHFRAWAGNNSNLTPQTGSNLLRSAPNRVSIVSMFRFCQRAGALLLRRSPRLRSDSSEFVFHSLVFEAPHFTYLEAQEFFVTSDATCEQPLQVQRRKVPKSAAPPLEFYVLPAVELYMFPGDVQNVSSTWRVLILPRSREVFGRIVYLCRKSQGLLNPCVAALHFPGLPLRLINLLIGWDPALDSSRSTPHRLLLLLEVLVLSLGLCATCLVLVSVRKMMKAAWKQHTPPPDGLRKETLLGDRLPKVYILIQHGFVYKEAGKGELRTDEPLDACREVTVLEMVQADRERRGLVEQLQHFLIHRGEFALWGRLADPPGWIVLANAAEDVRVIAKGATPSSSLFCANAVLLEPFPSLLRRQWVLTASHLSVQFYLLQSLSKMFETSIISVISASLLAIHLLVLCQMEMTHSAALLHEQVMESQGKLLNLTINKTVLALLVSAVGVLLVAVALGILRNESMVSATIPCTSLATAVAWHLMDFRLSLAGLGKWRSPQLRATEFIGTAAKGFETIRSSDLQALSRGRELQKQMIRLLVGLLGFFALVILVLLQIDGMTMRGELIDYSFSHGKLSIPANGLAIQNTLLLHTSVDNFVFRFEAGKYTSKVQFHLESAYDGDGFRQDFEFIFDENVDTEAGAGKRTGEALVFFPGGPLYSRLIVAASSHLQEAPTWYTVHLLRIGEATNLSLEAPINPAHFAENDSASTGLVDFHERRRWLYQQNNPVWYVPDLDARSNISLRVEQLPVVFAPMWMHEVWEASVDKPRDMMTTASTCLCGAEKAGFGTSCVVEELVTFPSGISICLFQYGLQRELHVDDGPGSLAVRDSTLLLWLSDRMFKPTALKLLAPTTGQVSEWWFSDVQLQQQQAGTHHGRLTSVLETPLPTEMLLSQVALLAAVDPGMDSAYAGGSEVSLKVVSRAPPIQLSMNSGDGFLLPEPSSADERTHFAACGLRDPAQVTGTTFDSRFVVKVEVVNNSHSQGCGNFGTDQVKLFKAARKPDSACSPYCSMYRPHADNYDVSVTFSVPGCLNEAVELDDLDAFRKILRGVANKSLDKLLHSCGILRKATQLNRSLIVSEITASLALRAGRICIADAKLKPCCFANNGIFSSIERSMPGMSPQAIEPIVTNMLELFCSQQSSSRPPPIAHEASSDLSSGSANLRSASFSAFLVGF